MASNPVGLLLGMNGVILLAYIVAIPANEIVIPTVLMLTVLVGGTPEVGAGRRRDVRARHRRRSACCCASMAGRRSRRCRLMLFSLLHNPCSTTIYTIYKETRSAKWTAVSTALPLVMGFVVCFLVAQVWRLVAGA